VSIDAEADGFYHPTKDAEIIALVTRACEEGRTLRVHGDGHSVAHAIYTDPLGEIDNKVKPPRRPAGKNIDIVLDRYEDGVPGFRVVPGEDHMIEVDGGMVLGSRPGRTGLLQQLSEQNEPWMLRSTGGIAHQTVGGFIATASAGGSLETSVNDLICGVTFIDGNGVVVNIDQGHDDFHAVVPHLGLFGVVTKVRLRCCPAFTVKGKQVTSTPKEAGLDLSGEGVGTPLADFLRAREYARLEWWPQRGYQRVRVWEGKSDGPPPSNFQPTRFHMFRPGEQPVAGVVLTVLGNLDDHERMWSELKKLLDGAGSGVVDELPQALRDIDTWGSDDVASLVEHIAGGGTRAAVEVRDLMARSPCWLPDLFPWLLRIFTPPGRVDFHDCGWRLLPMDDEVDDFYLPIEFTEIWVPLQKAADAMKHLQEYFDEPKTRRDAFARTGTFEIELYATKKSEFWLDPAYSDGTDLWSDGALRINPYWYGRNAGDPAQTFFPPFWDLLRKKGIPYRLHWGKFLPLVEQDLGWLAWIRAQYPCWDAYMRVRKSHDPQGIFVNDYWRKHLGLR
jgi:D-arabinono-1,4-lactone oxidase